MNGLLGARFAEEARRVHHGGRDAAAIRGRATPTGRAALADEGIDVSTPPIGAPPKATLQ
ncbi:MAG: DUF1178 family protein [Burkholderiaceae bacterium]